MVNISNMSKSTNYMGPFQLAEARKDEFYSMIPILFPSLTKKLMFTPKQFSKEEYLMLPTLNELITKANYWTAVSLDLYDEAFCLAGKIKNGKIKNTEKNKQKVFSLFVQRVKLEKQANTSRQKIIKPKMCLDEMVKNVDEETYGWMIKISNEFFKDKYVQQSTSNISELLNNTYDRRFQKPLNKITRSALNLKNFHDLLVEKYGFLEVSEKEASFLIRNYLKENSNLTNEEKPEFNKSILYLNSPLFFKGLGEEVVENISNISNQITKSINDVAVDLYGNYLKHYKTINATIATAAVLAAISLGAYLNRPALENTYAGINSSLHNTWLGESIDALTQSLYSKKTPEVASKQPQKTHKTKKQQLTNPLVASAIAQTKPLPNSISPIYPEGINITYTSSNPDYLIPLFIIKDSVNKSISILIDETKMNSDNWIDNLTIDLSEQYKDYDVYTHLSKILDTDKVLLKIQHNGNIVYCNLINID